MQLFKRQKTGCGFNLVSRNGNYGRLMRGKQAGIGGGEYSSSNKNDSIRKGSGNNAIKNLSYKMNDLSIKQSKPKRYISLNL